MCLARLFYSTGATAIFVWIEIRGENGKECSFLESLLVKKRPCTLLPQATPMISKEKIGSGEKS